MDDKDKDIVILVLSCVCSFLAALVFCLWRSSRSWQKSNKNVFENYYAQQDQLHKWAKLSRRFLLDYAYEKLDMEEEDNDEVAQPEGDKMVELTNGPNCGPVCGCTPNS